MNRSTTVLLILTEQLEVGSRWTCPRNATLTDRGFGMPRNATTSIQSAAPCEFAALPIELSLPVACDDGRLAWSVADLRRILGVA